MIKLRKGVLPPEIAAKIGSRAARLREYLNNHEEPPESLLNAYRDPEMKDFIKRETHAKCAYCESKITHVYPGDVEHIIPKDARPDLRLVSVL